MTAPSMAAEVPISARSGRDVNQLPAVMDAEDMVDAALVGFDRKEDITVTHLPNIEQWHAFAAVREIVLPQFAQSHAPGRYR
jgi:uncharacterized protein